MIAEFYWIKNLPIGRIAIMPRPRAGDWLDDEIASLQAAGIQILVSLLTEDEISELGLENEPEKCSLYGIEFQSFPIKDRCIPPKNNKTSLFFDNLHQKINKNLALAVHCRIGIGRSALVIAALMKRMGYTSEEALVKISEARGLQVPDTQEQKRWIEEFK